jgi:hypothetical protein
MKVNFNVVLRQLNQQQRPIRIGQTFKKYTEKFINDQNAFLSIAPSRGEGKQAES